MWAVVTKNVSLSYLALSTVVERSKYFGASKGGLRELESRGLKLMLRCKDTLGKPKVANYAWNRGTRWLRQGMNGFIWTRYKCSNT